MKFLLKLLLALALLAVLLVGGLRIAAHLREGEDITALPTQMRLLPHPDGDIAIMDLAPDAPEGAAPVLLIHGSVGYSLTWLHTAEALVDAGFAPVAMDLPPMGYSQRSPDGDYGRAATAERILRVARQLDIRPHLVAHSFGAGAAVEAAMQAPDQFASLTLIAAALPLDPPPDAALPPLLQPLWMRELAVSATVTNPLVARPLLQQFLHRDDTATDEILATLRRPSRQQGATSALARWLPNLLLAPADLPSSQSVAYGSIALPTALIWGERDTTTPLAQGQALQSLIPDSTLTVLPDIGHIPMVEDQEALNAALIAALPAP